MSRRLTRADVLAATKVPTEDVYVPELRGMVTVRGMTGAERDAYEATLFKGKGRHREINLANARAKLVAFCCVDDRGQRIFSDDDITTLGTVRADIVNRLSGPAQRLSGITEEDIDELGQPTESPAASGSSFSVSPENSG